MDGFIGVKTVKGTVEWLFDLAFENARDYIINPGDIPEGKLYYCSSESNRKAYYIGTFHSGFFTSQSIHLRIEKRMPYSIYIRCSPASQGEGKPFSVIYNLKPIVMKVNETEGI